MKKMTVYIVLFLLLALSGCEKASITGTGRTGNIQRNTGQFVGVQNYGDIKVTITYGNNITVTVSGYENLIAITETEVKNDLLHIKYSDQYKRIKNSNIEVKITMPLLNRVHTYGSGNVSIRDFLQGDSITGSIHGSSTLQINNCAYTHSFFDIHGSGDILAQHLLCQNSTLNQYGSGNILISCSRNLSARIFGSGEVGYWGNPALDVQIQGSGRVIKKG